jgi:CheY-like chemotaxis protein
MRVAARRGSIVEHSTLVGYSILVVEQEPFVASCVQMLLEGAGAEVHCAMRAGEALLIIDRKDISAAVLDCSKSAKGGRRVAQRLARLGLPFVVCKDVGQDEAWLGVPILIKPVVGGELVEMLCRLVHAGRERLPSPKIEHSALPLGDTENLVLASGRALRPRAPVKEIWHGKP